MPLGTGTRRTKVNQHRVFLPHSLEASTYVRQTVRLAAPASAATFRQYKKLDRRKDQQVATGGFTAEWGFLLAILGILGAILGDLHFVPVSGREQHGRGVDSPRVSHRGI